MWSIRDIRKKGKSAFKRNYWRSVVVAALMFLLTSVSLALIRMRSKSILQNVGFEPLHEMTPNEILIIAGIVIVGYMSIIVFAVLVKIICFNALEAGGCMFFRNNVEEGTAKLTLIRKVLPTTRMFSLPSFSEMFFGSFGSVWDFFRDWSRAIPTRWYPISLKSIPTCQRSR